MAQLSRFNFDFNLPKKGPGAIARRSESLRILLLGDFSAGGVAEANPRIAERPLVPTDIDNIDEVLWRIAPRLSLNLEGSEIPVELEFRSLEDFHPDALYQRLEVFRRLRELRQRLLDPATFGNAAAALREEAKTAGLADVPAAETSDEAPAPSAETDSEAIDRLLGKQPVRIPDSVSKRRLPMGAIDLDAFVRKIVAPHIVSVAQPHQDVYVRSVDQSISAQMRALLHAPAFQALESTWRSARGLVTNLETGEALKIYLLDATREELAADIGEGRADLGATGLYRLLVDRGVGMPGGEPWSLLVGDYTFGASREDIALLAVLGAIALRAGGPFLAAAEPALIGCDAIAQASEPADWRTSDAEELHDWQALRRSAVAPWLGLVLPRVFQRLPYGKATDPVEGFDFEELYPEREHQDYLWGNPAFACALLIARAYLANGWDVGAGDYREVDDLPAHIYSVDGESAMQACAEVYLSERAGNAVLERGIMPLLSYRGRNAVRVARFQSIAAPASALAGPWT